MDIIHPLSNYERKIYMTIKLNNKIGRKACKKIYTHIKNLLDEYFFFFFDFYTFPSCCTLQETK